MQGGEREVAERVNGWVRDAVREHGVFGTRAVTLAYLAHPDATEAEKDHIRAVDTVMRNLEFFPVINRPENFIVISGV